MTWDVLENLFSWFWSEKQQQKQTNECESNFKLDERKLVHCTIWMIYIELQFKKKKTEQTINLIDILIKN